MSAEEIAGLERRIAALDDERAIARVLASYGPLVDAGEATTAAGLWTENGIYDVDQWLMDGRAAIADMVRSEAHQGLIARMLSFLRPADDHRRGRRGHGDLPVGPSSAR